MDEVIEGRVSDEGKFSGAHEDGEGVGVQSSTEHPAPTAQVESDSRASKRSKMSFADLNLLFTNDKLKQEPLTVVIRSDPFCIPRVTDNVPEYRPMLNPLSILESEERLLPRYFRLDPSEGIPEANERNGGRNHDRSTQKDHLEPPDQRQTVHQNRELVSRTEHDIDSNRSKRSSSGLNNPCSVRRGLPPQPAYVDVDNALMGTLPREPNREIHPRNSTVNSTLDSIPLTNVVKASEVPQVSMNPVAAAPSALLQDMKCATTTQSEMSGGLSDPQHPLSQHNISEPMTDTSSSRNRSQPAIRSKGTNAGDTLMNFLPARDVDEFETIQKYRYAAPSPTGLPHCTLAPAMSSMVSPSPFMVQQPMPLLQSHLPSQVFSTPPTVTNTSMPPKKPRSKNVFRPCNAPGCTKGARGKSGLCQKHGGGKRCVAPNCTKGAQGSSNLCLFHGGGYRCTVEGCTTGARGTSGLCAKHGGYKKVREVVGAEEADRKRLKLFQSVDS